MSVWWNDFKISKGEIYVRTTGARIPITRAHTQDTVTWFIYYCVEKFYGLRRVFSKPTARIACVPAPPRAWYLLWAAAYRAGVDLKAQPHTADVILHFQDKTHYKTETERAPDLPSINAQCTDISKTHVQNVFEKVFHYSLAVDPQNHHGKMVEKSDLNGLHDGRIITGPAQPRKGYVYQRVINNAEDGYVLDLRCPTAGGHIDLIYLKRRPESQRFDNLNSSCHLAKPDDYLTAAERKTLSEFCAAMKLDWGGLDVLRDKKDGRLYVVDVNKTDMGPPLCLPLKDKMRSVSILSKSFMRMLNTKRAQSE